MMSLCCCCWDGKIEMGTGTGYRQEKSSTGARGVVGTLPIGGRGSTGQGTS